MKRFVLGILACLLVPHPSAAEVVRITVEKREPWLGGKAFADVGAYELVRGTAYYEIDPTSPEAKGIADIRLAPRNSRGKVAYSGPFLLLRPQQATKGNGTTLLEIANRGGTQENGGFFVADKFDLPDPGTTALEDETVFKLGYTLAWPAWQAQLPDSTFALKVPTGRGHGPVRFTFVPEGEQIGTTSTTLESHEGGYCSRSLSQVGTELHIKTQFDQIGEVVPKSAWRFARPKDGKSTPDRCYLTVDGGFKAQRLYELTYQGEDAPIVGLGHAAIRDFATALRTGQSVPFRASDAKTVIAYGYSQSGRFLRDYLYRDFNRRRDSGKVFDGMLIFAAGAGRGSFDHRYAMPGEAGNSVMSALRPVDIYPFADMATPDLGGGAERGLLDRARAHASVPAIMYVYTSSEYWARGGSLLTTTTDGLHEVPLAPQSRLYVFSGSVHAPQRPKDYQQPESLSELPLNPMGDQFWAAPALLQDMKAWIEQDVAPPPSIYPHLGHDLVPVDQIGFPRLKGVKVPSALPPIWRLDFGPDYMTTGVISRDPPQLGQRYQLFVPKVDSDGNETGGWHGILTSVPLGTLTAWNWPIPGYRSFGVLSQLGGAYIPFATDLAARQASEDPRPSLAERYGDKDGYLRAVGEALDHQILARMLLPSQRADALAEASHVWDGTIKLNTIAGAK